MEKMENFHLSLAAKRRATRFRRKLGVQYCDVYGLSEIMGPGVAMECSEANGLHLCEDQFLAEIVNPDTFEPVPDGEFGELVITTLTRQCTPLIRYRTRDLTRFIPGECACGRTHKKIDRIVGRTDDMLIIRGVNVFPSQIEQVVNSFDEITPALPNRAHHEGHARPNRAARGNRARLPVRRDSRARRFEEAFGGCLEVEFADCC